MTVTLHRRAFIAAAASAVSQALLAPSSGRATPTVPRRILMVSTSIATKPDGRPTGLWLSELTTPYFLFRDAGVDVTMASMTGGPPPVDPRSMAGPRGRGPSVERFERSADAMAAFRAMPALASIVAERFDAVFLCGGHGTMWDFRESAALGAAVTAIDARGGVVAALCHGPAGLLSARRADGRSILEGRRATGFTDAEEAAVGLTDAVPYLLETEMRRLGARFEVAANFQPHAIRDGAFVTGQNPASAEATARFTLEALAATPARTG
jgi:putative intracellular protease/amidase